jgi:hypothetical protein
MKNENKSNEKKARQAFYPGKKRLLNEELKIKINRTKKRHGKHSPHARSL